MADSSGFDHFRRGEPLPGLLGADPTGFDHFRRGEPVPALEPESGSVEQIAASITGSAVLACAITGAGSVAAALTGTATLSVTVDGGLSPARIAATTWGAVLGTLCDVLESAPLSLAPVSWHGESPSAAQLSASECYDLDLGLPGDLLVYSGGVADAIHPVEVVIYKRRAQWRDARDDHADLTDLAEDVRRVVRERSGLEIAADPVLDVLPADGADALEGRVRFRVRYQLAVTDS